MPRKMSDPVVVTHTHPSTTTSTSTPTITPSTSTNLPMVLALLVLLPTMVGARSMPTVCEARWDQIDVELNHIIGPLHHLMGMDEIPSDEAARQFSETLSTFLSAQPEFQQEALAHYTRDPPASLEEARKLKNALRKIAKRRNATEEDKANFNNALRHYSFLLKKQKEKQSKSKTKKHEDSYRKNFFSFAKDASNGTLESESIKPSFTKEQANQFYTERYSNPVAINPAALSWYPAVAPPTVQFDQSPFTPRQVKGIMKGKSPTTAPGEDGLLYGVLAKLPCVHHFLATLYNKTSLSGLAPATWASSRVVLVHKAGDTSDPTMFRPIALTSCLGKPYHQLKADRMAAFMVGNNYIDPSIQKAFLKGINGCIEHIQVLQEIIQDAKINKRTVHISWFDLSDAYGSISHELIEHSLHHYNVPESEIKYVRDLYSKLCGRVVTDQWESDIFHFRKGIFQGDNYSPIIFNVVFQPLLDFIVKHKDSHGYSLGNTKVITKPFADDFEILTNNKIKHKKLQNEVQIKAESMGLFFKPSKCRTLSICGGKATNIPFFLTNRETNELIQLKSLEDDPFKFLGSVVTFNNTAQDQFMFVKDKLEQKLVNLDTKCWVRGEYKVAVYSRYILPSMRYHLTVHSMHQCHLDQLDQLGQKYLKQWLGIPPRGCTNLGIFHPFLLGIKHVSQVYLEGHMTSLINSSLVADLVTKEALRCTATREGEWVKKSSTINQCKKIMQEMEETHFFPTPTNTNNYETACRLELPKLKKGATAKVAARFLERATTQAEETPLQGELATLLAEEEGDIPWKATIFSVPKGVMAFAVRACTNTLATPDNLARWGRRIDKACHMEGCNATGTLGHLLSCCKVMLEQGRYTYRHDSVLKCLVNTLSKDKPQHIDLYADLEGHNINGTTLPPEVAMTASRPDLVLVNSTERKVVMVELTCPWDSVQSIENARARKEERYAALAADIETNGYTCMVVPLEVGARGHISRRNRDSLTFLATTCKVKALKNFYGQVSKTCLLGSYRIWLARQSQDWTAGPLLT